MRRSVVSTHQAPARSASWCSRAGPVCGGSPTWSCLPRGSSHVVVVDERRHRGGVQPVDGARQDGSLPRRHVGNHSAGSKLHWPCSAQRRHDLGGGCLRTTTAMRAYTYSAGAVPWRTTRMAAGSPTSCTIATIYEMGGLGECWTGASPPCHTVWPSTRSSSQRRHILDEAYC